MAESSQGSSTIRERLDEFYRRLASLPPAESAEIALKQICDTLDAVEDEMSGIAKKDRPPPPSMPDGRMYGPLQDHVLRRADGSILALTRGHRIEIESKGTLRIINKVTTVVEFEK